MQMFSCLLVAMLKFTLQFYITVTKPDNGLQNRIEMIIWNNSIPQMVIFHINKHCIDCNMIGLIFRTHIFQKNKYKVCGFAYRFCTTNYCKKRMVRKSCECVEWFNTFEHILLSDFVSAFVRNRIFYNISAWPCGLLKRFQDLRLMAMNVSYKGVLNPSEPDLADFNWCCLFWNINTIIKSNSKSDSARILLFILKFKLV